MSVATDQALQQLSGAVARCYVPLHAFNLCGIFTYCTKRQLQLQLHSRGILSLLVAYGLCTGACPWHLASERMKHCAEAPHSLRGL
jgi:hypothetical protein